MIEYVYYKGVDFIAMGTSEEVAKVVGVKPRTIEFYASPIYRKRAKSYTNNAITVIRLEPDEKALICPCCKKPFYRSELDE